MAEQLICNQQVDGSTPFTSSSIYGGIPERPKGADCKSVVTDFAGPNPASPTITKNRPMWSVFCYGRGSSLFELGTPRHKAQVLLVRIPHPKIEELALQAQGEGIFTFGEYPASMQSTLVVGFFVMACEFYSHRHAAPQGASAAGPHTARRARRASS